MNTTQRKTMMEKIEKHGSLLIKLFGGPDSLQPVALCKVLRRIETNISRKALDYCNGIYNGTFEQLTDNGDKYRTQIAKLLPGLPARAIHINYDPRGYALKIDDAFMRSEEIFGLHRDFGGYGILAPDFTPDNL